MMMVQNINDILLTMQSHVLHHHVRFIKNEFSKQIHILKNDSFSHKTAVFKPFKKCEMTLTKLFKLQCIVQPQNI